jgi:hypothetical protein
MLLENSDTRERNQIPDSSRRPRRTQRTLAVRTGPLVNARRTFLMNDTAAERNTAPFGHDGSVVAHRLVNTATVTPVERALVAALVSAIVKELLEAAATAGGNPPHKR